MGLLGSDHCERQHPFGVGGKDLEDFQRCFISSVQLPAAPLCKGDTVDLRRNCCCRLSIVPRVQLFKKNAWLLHPNR